MSTLKLDRKDVIVNIARRLSRELPQFSIDDLVHEMLREGFEPRESAFQLLKREARAVLRRSKDRNGVREFINAVDEKTQTTIWATRRDAPYHMRLEFLRAQEKRCKDDINALKELVATMNAERRAGEPEFQLTLFD